MKDEVVERWISDTELDQQIKLAQENYEQRRLSGLWAVSADFNQGKGTIDIVLANRAEFLCPYQLIEGLQEASPEQLKELHLSGDGSSIHWDNLDIDLSILELISGIFGTQRWMSLLAQRGGKKKSAAKSAAAKKNGMKGGRPRKKTIGSQA